MGYRSNIVLAIEKETKLKAILANKFFDENEIETIKETEDVIYYFMEDWKWYNLYKIVQNIDTFMDFMEDEDILFGFIRIGENLDDVEFRGNPYEFDLSFTREINTPVGDL